MEQIPQLRKTLNSHRLPQFSGDGGCFRHRRVSSTSISISRLSHRHHRSITTTDDTITQTETPSFTTAVLPRRCCRWPPPMVSLHRPSVSSAEFADSSPSGTTSEFPSSTQHPSSAAAVSVVHCCLVWSLSGPWSSPRQPILSIFRRQLFGSPRNNSEQPRYQPEHPRKQPEQSQNSPD